MGNFKRVIELGSDDKERYEILREAELLVIPWEKASEIQMVSPDETISHALRRFAEECHIIGKEVLMSGIPEKIRITKKTIGESISAMRRQQADLMNLGKVFTILEPVLENAILLEVEPFRYPELRKAGMILGEYHFLSAFHDYNVLYPVKITVERYKKSDYTNIHVIITVGKNEIAGIAPKSKRSVAYTGVHPSMIDGESLFSEDASFAINIQHLVKLFNRSEGIILKHFPDVMLTDEQKHIKGMILERDEEKTRQRSGTSTQEN